MIEALTDIWSESGVSCNPSPEILFSNAVQCWALCQRRDVTVNEACLSFNCSPMLIREAVEHHPWMRLGPDDTIEHDGE